MNTSLSELISSSFQLNPTAKAEGRERERDRKRSQAYSRLFILKNLSKGLADKNSVNRSTDKFDRTGDRLYLSPS